MSSSDSEGKMESCAALAVTGWQGELLSDMNTAKALWESPTTSPLFLYRPVLLGFPSQGWGERADRHATPAYAHRDLQGHSTANPPTPH